MSGPRVGLVEILRLVRRGFRDHKTKIASGKARLNRYLLYL